MATKREKLQNLDEEVCDTLLDLVRNKRFEEISNLSVAVQYLKANEQVSEKEKKSANQRHQDMVKEAKRRRRELG